MAFMGMFLAFMAVVLIILGTCAFIVFVCFLTAGLIMLHKRRKNQGGGKVKQPWYVITLRIIGALATLPIILAVGLIVYAIIADTIDKNTNLARAVMSYDYVRAERILERGADPDIRDEYGRTLLMCIAVHEDYISADDGERYDCTGNSSWDDDEDIQMMELLLDYGADINAAVTYCGDDSAHEYGEDGWNDIYANSDHFCGNTALIYAVRYRSSDVVEFLLENGADVNAANSCGFTPLLMCADMRTDSDDGLEIASMLLDEGADPDAVTNFHQDIIWLLIRHANDDNIRMTSLIESEM